MQAIELYQGDSSDIIYARPDLKEGEVIDSNWQCKMAITDINGNVVLDPVTITQKTDDNLYFIVALEPEHTRDLLVTGVFSQFSWAIEMSNARITPSYNKEKHRPLIVYQQCVI